MGMKTIARYMYFSGSIDLTPEKERYLRLPESGARLSVLLSPARAASFSSACSSRVLRMLAG
jgi:hypothetical protein